MLQSYSISFVSHGSTGDKSGQLVVRVPAFYVAYAKAREMQKRFHLEIKKISKLPEVL